MSQAELISACIKNDKTAKQQFFKLYINKFKFIALRYSKNDTQSEDVLLKGMAYVFSKLHSFKSQTALNIDEFVKNEFIIFAVKYIKEIRSEYYVASTVKVTENADKTYDLFLDSKYVDLNNVNEKVLLKSIQALVPSHRLLFNLHVIDGYTLENASELLDTNAQSTKSNLEKARYSLQKLIEYNLKINSDE